MIICEDKNNGSPAIYIVSDKTNTKTVLWEANNEKVFEASALDVDVQTDHFSEVHCYTKFPFSLDICWNISFQCQWP